MTAALLALVVRLLPDREWGRAMQAEFASWTAAARAAAVRARMRTRRADVRRVAACESAGCAWWAPRSRSC